jgi:hypothetical protein
MTDTNILPNWTVISRFNSPESNAFAGKTYEFFLKEEDATLAYQRHITNGNNVIVKRPFHHSDKIYLN